MQREDFVILPLYKYKRSNAWLLIIGTWIDCFFKLLGIKDPIKDQKITETELFGRILIFESHLIGDGVMTLSLAASIRKKYPESILVFIGNYWMKDIIGGVFDETFFVKVPWSTYDYSLRSWWDLLKALYQIRAKNISIAIETRGDIRNSIFLFCMKAKIRLGVNLSAGVQLLTHTVSIDADRDPLWKIRKKIIDCFPGRLELEYPDYPAPSTQSFVRLQHIVQTDFILIHPGGSDPRRRLPQSIFYKIAKKVPPGIKVICCVGPHEQDWVLACKESNPDLSVEFFSGTLPDFLYLASKAYVSITMDSGPAHLVAWAACRHLFILCSHDRPDLIIPFTPFPESIQIYSYSEWDRVTEEVEGIIYGISS